MNLANRGTKRSLICRATRSWYILAAGEHTEDQVKVPTQLPCVIPARMPDLIDYCLTFSLGNLLSFIHEIRMLKGTVIGS